MTFPASSKTATDRAFSSLMFAKSSGFFKGSCLEAALVTTTVRSEAQQATVIVSQKIPRIGMGLSAFRRLDFADAK